VVTSNEETYVKIAWSEPTYNGGSPILGFEILIKQKDGTLVENTEFCDGSE
jgi:hypothetical protein